jgi:hypothetical protein
VDAGVIMRLDCDFDDATHSVWLAQVSRVDDTFSFEFHTDAADEPLIFNCVGTSGVGKRNTLKVPGDKHRQRVLTPTNSLWIILNQCGRGLLSWGPLKICSLFLYTNSTVTFVKNARQLEPGRIQNLAKSYVRKIGIGNYSRPYIPECGEELSGTAVTPDILLAGNCFIENVKLKEGYNCTIRQKDWINEITISAVKGAAPK